MFLAGRLVRVAIRAARDSGSGSGRGRGSGNGSSPSSYNAPIQLAPFQNPICRFEGFVSSSQETIVIKEKAFSTFGGDSDSFYITNAQGQPVLNVQGRHMSVSGRKSVFDLNGNHLYDMVKQHLTLHTTFVAEDGGGQFLQIQSNLQYIGSRATGTFTDANGLEHTFSMGGNAFDTSATITLGPDGQGPVLAVIQRKMFNRREMIAHAQTYHVTIAPGVDIALMVAMCVALDEKNNEPRRGGRGGRGGRQQWL